MQNESTKDMIFDVAQLVAYCSQVATLVAGHLVLTGSPAGNGIHWGRPLQPGDVMESEITGLGVPPAQHLRSGIGDVVTRPDAVAVDVHAHAMFPAVEATARSSRATPDSERWSCVAQEPNPPRSTRRSSHRSGRRTNPAQRLAAMDHAGVDVQVVSPMPPTTTGRTRHSQDGSRGSPTKA